MTPTQESIYRNVRRFGFTLAELLVVLVILAALTTVAVQSLEPLAQRSRIEATQRTMQAFHDAVIGSDSQRHPDGSVIVSGFVADVGRLPIVKMDNDVDPTGAQWSELWNTADLGASFTHKSRKGPINFHGADLSDVSLFCGWKGPYLLRSNDWFADAWGNEFQGSSVADIYARPPSGDDIHPIRRFPSVNVRVLGKVVDGITGLPPETGDCDVYLLYPDPDAPNGELRAMSPAAMSDGEFTFESVPIGVRGIQAFLNRGSSTQRTLIKYVNVPTAGLSNVNLPVP